MAKQHYDDPADSAPAATDPQDAPAPALSAEADALADLKRERDDLYDRLLRKTAEFDNYRKRVDRERREQADQGIADLLEDLLLVVDDFELALSVDPSDAGLPPATQGDAYRKGVELIYGKLQDLMRKRGVRPIAALGADFDPNLHQAVVHEASPDHREGEVIGELRRGYMLGDRLLRPAMVKVAKA
jgi:molecular chaperone GrpE